jgi:IS5 family transposase
MKQRSRKSKPRKPAKSKSKAVYRVKNWRDYDKSLVQRGSLTFWIDEAALKQWVYQGPAQQGAQFDYSDRAIQMTLTIREVFRLTNRATEGLVRSLFQLLKVDLKVPDHSTLSRRGKTLKVTLPKRAGGELHLVLDSSGLKVYGEGEWKVRQHGWSKRRTWRKMHLTIEAESGEIQAAILTEARVHDAQVAPEMIQQVAQPIASVSADGSYDRHNVYAALAVQAPQAQVNIPPRRDAKIWQHGNCHQPALARDENLRQIRQQGRKQWKVESGYHRRSLGETAMFRFKTIFGDHLSARGLETQSAQFGIRCRALNQMTHLGMPQSVKVC